MTGVVDDDNDFGVSDGEDNDSGIDDDNNDDSGDDNNVSGVKVGVNPSLKRDVASYGSHY